MAVKEYRGAHFSPLCDGVVREEAVRAALGDGEIRRTGKDEHGSPESGLLAECKAMKSDKSKYVTFSAGSTSFGSKVVDRVLNHDLFEGNVSTPLGSKWPGVLTIESPGIAYATVVLRCSSPRYDNLLINIKSMLVHKDARFSDPAERLKLARAAAAMSKEANKRWKCGAQLGEKIRRAPADAIRSRPKPLSDATGTCRSLRKLAPAAKKWGITQAIGAESVGEAPTQDCLLADAKGRNVYRLSALTGPFARGYRDGGNLGQVPGKAGREKRGGLGLGQCEVP